MASLSRGNRLLAATALALAAALSPSSPLRAEDREYRTADGHAVTLRAPAGGATALVFYSTECPISNYYSATLNEIVRSAPDGKFKLIGVCADPDLAAEDLASHAAEYRLEFSVIADPGGRLAAAFRATKTPEVVLLDDRGRVRYQGRIDDQYADRRVKTQSPKTHELRDALAAVLAGRDVAEPTVPAVGCPIPGRAGADAEGSVTYARDVAPILNKHCRECHRKGQIGPFPLEDYAQASKRAADLLDVVERRIMPPWKPTPGFGQAFLHDRSMGPEEVATLAAWVDADAPEGDPADLPAPPTFQDDWKLGKPDLIVELPEDFAIPATGGDIYRCFVIPTDLPEDKYIAGIEYRPGNPRVVHHILGYVDTSGEARKRDAAEDGAGYTCFGGPQIDPAQDLGGWAPGAEPGLLPEGIGRSLPKGGDVVIQVHYHPNGKPETDRSRVGLYFATKPTKKTFHWWVALNQRFVLQPDDPKTWEVPAQTLPLPVDVEVLALAPHMHLLGKDMEMWAEVPTGEGDQTKRIDLIKIDDWDFQWQNQYYLAEPITLPKGSVVKLISHFDNSADNPRNPSKPPKPVGWGEATTDEMCIGFFGIVKKDQDLTRPGEKDDLIDILEQQVQDYRKEMEKKRKGRGEKAAAGGE
jgi:hypothetical protein